MSAEEVDRAVRRVEARRPDLTMAARAVAGGLTAGEGIAMIHQAALQQYRWWYLPRDYPKNEWQGLVEAATALLDELGLPHLADVARCAATQTVLAAWAHGRKERAAAFRAAHAESGVEPPDTALLAWGSVMGVDEVRAVDAVERALGDAVAAGTLVPGAPRWHAKAAAITEAVLSRPLDLPPGQTLAALVTTERIGTWINGARHPVQRSEADIHQLSTLRDAANRLRLLRRRGRRLHVTTRGAELLASPERLWDQVATENRGRR